MELKNKVTVHNGIFHTDDVCSYAWIRLFYPNMEINRKIAVEEDETGVDIGFGMYDHHQKDAVILEDGVKPCGFGLLVRDSAKEVQEKYGINEEMAKFVIDSFVSDFVVHIDNTDNYGQEKFPNTLAYLISHQQSVSDPVMQDGMFYMLGTNILHMFENVMKQLVSSAIIVEKIKGFSDELVINDTEEHLPTQLFKYNKKVNYIIQPSIRGGYMINAVNEGKLTTENCPHANFVHTGGFIAAFNTLEEAVEDGKKIIEDGKKED